MIKKTKASAFFGTPLREVLHDLNVDSLFVCGTTTSGCVRATIVDAFSHGLKCFLVEEGTFDRFELSHLVNLWDINAKYADVITVDEAVGPDRRRLLILLNDPADAEKLLSLPPMMICTALGV